MTDAELDRSRKALLALVPRIGTAGRQLVRAICATDTMPELRASREFDELRRLLGELSDVIRRSAGPEDLAKLEGSKAQ